MNTCIVVASWCFVVSDIKVVFKVACANILLASLAAACGVASEHFAKALSCGVQDHCVVHILDSHQVEHCEVCEHAH